MRLTRGSAHVHAGRICLALSAVLSLAPPNLAAADLADAPDRFEPTIRYDQPWNIVSLAEDGGLGDANIFFVDFEPDGTAWLATSTGLVRYDGYEWRRFGRSDGLPSDFVRSVLVARDGRVWVGTDEGIAVSDGEVFQVVDASNFVTPSVRRIVEDPDGTLWFCSDRWLDDTRPGGITVYRRGAWTRPSVEELPTDYIVDYFRASTGRQYLLTPSGVFVDVDGHWTLAFRYPDDAIHASSATIAETKDGHIFISLGPMVVILRDGAEPASIRLHPEFRYAVGVDPGGDIVAVGPTAPDTMQFLRLDGHRLVAASAPVFTSSGYFIEAVRSAPDGSIWAVGNGILLRWLYRAGEWTEYQRLAAPVAEADGGVWFVAPDLSVVRNDGERWSRVFDDSRGFARDRSGTMWFVTRTSVIRWTDAGPRIYNSDETSVVAPYGVAVDPFSRVWVHGRGQNGTIVAVSHDGRAWSRPVELHGRGDARVEVDPDPLDGVWYLVIPPTAEAIELTHARAEASERFLIERFSSRLRLHAARDRIWLFSVGGLYGWDRETAMLSHHEGVVGVVNDAVDVGRALWLTVAGYLRPPSGLVRHMGGAWEWFPARDPGRMVVGADGTVTVADIGVVHVIRPRSAEPLMIPLPMRSRTSAGLIDRRGNLWVGTGTSVYRRRSLGRAPDTRLTTASFELQQDGDARIDVAAVDRFMPVHPGRRFRASWRADGGAWSAFRSVSTIEIPTAGLMGQHVVDVRAQDEDGDVDPTPATLAFIVPPVPLQSRSWFVPLIVVAMGTFVGLTMLSWVGRRRALAAGVALDAANAELDAFNYGVSHDLNAPLRNLERLTAQLRGRPVGEVDAAGLETLARIQSLAVRMQRLVDGLRDLSSITRAPIVRTPLELGEIARSIAADLAAADPLRRVRWTIQPRLITEGDPNLVPNLLRNLLENAWKFTRLESDAVIEVGAERLPRRRLAFFVRDNGVGFDPALADRLFVPFQRLHGADEFPGDGIGLATVRRIVSRHGGRVWAEAAVGRGATFYFTLEAGG